VIKSTSSGDIGTFIEGNQDAEGVKLGEFDSACEGAEVTLKIPSIEAIKEPLVVLLKVSPSRKRRTPATDPMSAMKIATYPSKTEKEQG
jgi:hypothetical protein